MITDEEYVEIEILRKHGMSLRKIAGPVKLAGYVGRTAQRQTEDELKGLLWKKV